MNTQKNGVGKFLLLLTTKLKDYNNDIIEGYFYEPELQIAYLDNDIVYTTEKILKKTRNKKKDILVMWKGCPKKFNSWILEESVESIKT